MEQEQRIPQASGRLRLFATLVVSATWVMVAYVAQTGQPAGVLVCIGVAITMTYSSITLLST